MNDSTGQRGYRRLTYGLAAIRRNRKLTQFDLARRALVDAVTISRLENLRNPPIPETAQRLARVLDVDVEQLYAPEPDMTRLSQQKQDRTDGG